MPTNRQILLDNRPKGEASVDNFKLVTTETPPLKDGQVLVRHHFLSLDPYMRGRMNDSKSYAEPHPLNTVMIGGTVGEVVLSKHPKFAVGDSVVGMGGWQEYSVVDVGQRGMLNKVDTTHIPLSAYLGAVGMPGMTAWTGLNRIAKLQAGELIHVGEGEYRQIYALHLTGAAIQEGGARPFHLVGGWQVDAGQGDLDRGAGLGGAGEGQRGATEQQGERFHRDSLAV